MIACPSCGYEELVAPSGSRNPMHHCPSCQGVFSAAALVEAERDRARRSKASRKGHAKRKKREEAAGIGGPATRAMLARSAKKHPHPNSLLRAASLSLLIKLGSLVVHWAEFDSSDGESVDMDAMRTIAKDPEVLAWITSMGALLPVPRSRR